MTTQAILVSFRDNDFYNTWINVLNHIKEAKPIFSIKDKKKLAFILSQAAWAMYVLHQNQCSYNGLETYSKDYIKHTMEYLTIEPDQILLDDEVTAYLSENDWGNGETFYIFDHEGATAQSV